MNNASIKRVLFDSVKEKYVTDNLKNRRRLERQNDVAHREKSSTFMKRLRLKLNKLKLGTIVHLSIVEINKHYGRDSIVSMGMDILNALPNERIMMKIGNKSGPLNIDNIRNLNKWFYPYEEQDDFCSDEAFKKAVMCRPFITLIPLTTKHLRQVHTGAFFKYYYNTKLDLS